MATTLVPVQVIPSTSGSIAGQFTAGAAMIRLSVALLKPGADNLIVLQQQASGYWAETPYVLPVKRGQSGFAGAAASLDIPANDNANYFVLSESGFAASSSNATVTFEDLLPSTAVTVPAIPGDTLALVAAAQSLSSKTLVSPVISTGLTASGSAANDFSGSTGDFTLSTGALSWAGANAKAASLVATGAALTLTGGAASTWGTSSGALNLSGFAGLNFKVAGTLVADVGATDVNSVTLAAGKSLSGAAGAGALSFGSMTGATALPTGNLSWAGAATKTLSLAAAGAAAVTSSGGALTLTGGAASTWSTSSGALTVDSAAGLNLGTSSATALTIGRSAAVATFASKTAAGATTNAITDPGASGAIPVTANGVCPLTSAAAETRTLAIPTFVGQDLTICLDTDGGDVVVTVAQPINQAGNNTITLNDAGDTIILKAITVGGARRWRVAQNDGCVLTTV